MGTGAGPNRLRVLRFAPGASATGEVLGALERDEDAILDALVVLREPGSGELRATDLAIGRADGTIAGLVGFRIDARQREVLTRRTLADHGGVPAAAIERLAGAVEPGGAVVAVLETGGGPTALDDAVQRSAGELVADAAVAERELAPLAGELVAAAGR
jgi:hypothetical protein